MDDKKESKPDFTDALRYAFAGAGVSAQQFAESIKAINCRCYIEGTWDVSEPKKENPFDINVKIKELRDATHDRPI